MYALPENTHQRTASYLAMYVAISENGFYIMSADNKKKKFTVSFCIDSIIYLEMRQKVKGNDNRRGIVI